MTRRREVSSYADHNDYETVEEFDKAVEEVIDLVDYLEESHAEARLLELDQQFEVEGGK